MFRFRKKIYLDNNATTKVAPKVIKKMYQVLKKFYGNPSSLYKISYPAASLLDESRKIIADAISAEKDEITFTGSASEANNTIIKSLFELNYPDKNKIISSPVEHPSVLSVFDYLKTKGAKIDYLSVDKYGMININELESKIDDNTFLICCMYVNNETGIIFPVEEIASISHKHGIHYMADCVQAFGKINIDVRKSGIDYASLSAHKIYGPKGIGAMFVRKGCPVLPLIHGGHQENGMRAGTESTHNIAGFAEAAKDINNLLRKAENIRSVRDHFIENVKEIYPDLVINTPLENSAANTVSMTFPGVNNALFLVALDFRGIAVSAGSACNTQSNEPSHVLKSIGLTDKEARETLRFSFPDDIRTKDIRYVLKAIKEFHDEKQDSINMLSPGQFDESMIFHEDTYILDIRFDYDRKSIKSIPNSHEAPFWSIRKYLDQIPKNKNIVVICQTGVNSPLVAYYLK